MWVSHNFFLHLRKQINDNPYNAKTKDLAAVSAQQLLKSAPNAPVQINRFDLYDIESNATEHAHWQLQIPIFFLIQINTI